MAQERFEKLNFSLLGESEGVRDWQGLQVLATFDNDNQQANITTSELSFVDAMGKAIIEYIDGGLTGATNGIFEAPEFKMSIDRPNTEIFDGMLDLANDITINRDMNEVKCKLKLKNGLNQFAEVSQAITVGLLEEKGLIGRADYVNIPYIKVTDFEFFTAAIMTVSLLQMEQTFEDAIAKASESLAEAIALLSASLVPNPAITFTWAFLKAAIAIAWALIVVILIIRAATELIELLVHLKRYHKGIKFVTLIEKGVELAGYTFSSSIPEFENLYILPKKTQKGKLIPSRNDDGLPKSGGALYTLEKLIGLAKDLFKANVKIEGETLYLEPLKNVAFWERETTYNMPDVYTPIEKYNTDELIATKTISFATDPNDLFTLENFQGTNYEIRIRPNSINDDQRVLMKGLTQLEFPVALGSVKERYSIADTIAKQFAAVADKVAGYFGRNTNFSQEIESRISILKMSNDLVDVPKLLRLKSDYSMIRQYRAQWSAKYLYEQYHYWDSFVLNKENKQVQVFEKIKMPATLEDFLNVIGNNVGRMADGRTAKFESILYNFGAGYWEATFRVPKIYTENLNETYTEPE